MGVITCPRCSGESEGKPYRYQSGGYARCPYCNAGIKYSSTVFKTDIEEVSWYIPDGCSVSPKTDRILCGHRVHKSGRFVSFLFRKLARHPNPNAQSRRRGTLRYNLVKT